MKPILLIGGALDGTFIPDKGNKFEQLEHPSLGRHEYKKVQYATSPTTPREFVMVPISMTDKEIDILLRSKGLIS